MLAVAFLWTGGPRASARDTSATAAWDTFSDTWAATDNLGRRLPVWPQTGSPRQDRFIGIFYFLWLGTHANGGPYDVTKIKSIDPENPQWGPMYAPHHWGESIYGYYLTQDPFVLAKHAQMLTDAGVDTVIFDVTNQQTYKSNYMALLRTFDDIRRRGGKTPQIAFLCPFWKPDRVVTELWHDFYQPNLYPHLWFRWEGRPLILADSTKLADVEGGVQGQSETELNDGQTLGQTFNASRPFNTAGGCFPTQFQTNSVVTLSLYRNGPGGECIATERLPVADNEWLNLSLPTTQPPGIYYLEISKPAGRVGWWGERDARTPSIHAYANGQPCPGTRSWQISIPGDQLRQIQNFFTFRKPQPSYFEGPTETNMWSWLEVYPQHTFKNDRGEKEQMSVGVAQNAVTNRLGSMSEPGVRGRSFHKGTTVRKPTDVQHGYNFAEQFERALNEDPRFIFITGWNEWIASRHPEFNGIKGNALFPDEYDQENSRDIEPMNGGHGDNYYYQMTAFIRRFKGSRPLPLPGPQKTIRMNQDFEQWTDVLPEFRDDDGDTGHRDFPGFNNCGRYVTTSGRNDFLALKVARDERYLYFYARTRSPITRSSDPSWMMLLIDADQNHATGWEGYDFIVNRQKPKRNEAVLERNTGGWHWTSSGTIKFVVKENQLQLAIPLSPLDSRPKKERCDSNSNGLTTSPKTETFSNS